MLVNISGTLSSPLHANLHQVDNIARAVGGAKGGGEESINTLKGYVASKFGFIANSLLLVTTGMNTTPTHT